MNINDCLVCPKCSKKFLHKSANNNPKFGQEYFCHRCHIYFGVNELVNHWGFDVADLYPIYPVTFANSKGWYKNNPHLEPTQDQLLKWWGEDSLSPDVEAEWSSKQSRDEDYETVTRMLFSIPEWDGCGNDCDLYEFATGR